MKPENQPPSARSDNGPLAEDVCRCLSALVDGEAAALAQACQSWRDDAGARRTWHAYHLIGDVLRSEELAHPPGRDAAFLAGLRLRLADEPAIVAPAPPVAARQRQTWLMPAAAGAAGFVVVAGVLVVTQADLSGAPAVSATLAAASSPGVMQVDHAVAAALPTPAQTGVRVIRDARLDEYLRIHQAARSGVAAAMPGGGLHQVDALVSVGSAR